MRLIGEACIEKGAAQTFAVLFPSEHAPKAYPRDTERGQFGTHGPRVRLRLCRLFQLGVTSGAHQVPDQCHAANVLQRRHRVAVVALDELGD